MKKKPKKGGSRRGAGRPQSYPGEGRAVRRSHSFPADLLDRLADAAGQTGLTQSAIVVAGLRAVLAQSPDRLRESVS